jgi:hypothetical protein
METRKWKYIMIRKKQNQRVAVLLSIAVIYIIFSFFLKSMPVSYAWFTANTSSKGQIVNAAASDLIKIIPEQVTYDANKNIKAKLSVQNISNIDIPLKVELLVNNRVVNISSILLSQKDTYTTGTEDIKDISAETKDIKYRIIGFNGYINEVINYHVNQ